MMLLEAGKWYTDKSTGRKYYIAQWEDGSEIELINQKGCILSKSDEVLDLLHKAGIKLVNLCEENQFGQDE